jgi:CheY-like chemotaxis protein
VVTVRDSGIGIPPDMLVKIFDLFVQVEQPGARSHGGLGIGLTLAKNLVAMHDGRIDAHSDGTGTGSTFTVRLPLAVEPSDRTLPLTASGAQPWTSGRRLLIVDDNQDAALSLAMLLERGGAEVQVAHDGMSALEMAASFQPAMIFLDIGMPGMDGHEVARRIRKDASLASMVLVALTGWGSVEDRRRSAEAGFDHHLVKPVTLEALQEVLKAGLA